MPPDVIQPLHRGLDRSGFTCEEPALTTWFQQQARQQQDRGLSRTFVLMDENNESNQQIVGFYSLSATSVNRANLPENLRSTYPEIPAILIGRLARDERYKGKGIGKLLFADAIKRCANVAQHVGVALLIVDPKNQALAEYYSRIGFYPMVNDSMYWIPLKDAIHNKKP